MTATTQEMILDVLGNTPTCSVAELAANLEVPRSQKYLDQTLDLLAEVGEISMSNVAPELGNDGMIVTWERMPQPIEPEVVREMWQIPPSIPSLVSSGAWTSADGPKPGIYEDKSPPNRCSWTATYTVAGFETPEELLAGYEMTETMMRFEAADALALGYTGNAFLIELGRLMAEPGAWSDSHRNEVMRTLVDARKSYPQYQPHWEMTPQLVNMGSRERPDMQERYFLPMRVYGRPSFRRSWIPYEVEHAFAQVK